MKTKLTLTLTLALAAALFITTTAGAQQTPDVLKTRDALIAGHAKQLAEHDAKWEAVLGAGWKEKLADPATEAKVLVDAYIGKPFTFTLASKLPVPEAERLVAHILAKPVLVTDDLVTIKEAARVNPSFMRTVENKALIDSRVDELMALDPQPVSIARFQQKYDRIYKTSWGEHMTIGEWLLGATADFDHWSYKAMQDGILARATEALIEKKIGLGEAADGPDFDAAMAPVVTALNAPLFEGLAEALLPLGVKITMPDYTAIVAKVPHRIAAIERRSVAETEARKSLGTIMFVKGVTAYNAWKTARSKW